MVQVTCLQTVTHARSNHQKSWIWLWSGPIKMVTTCMGDCLQTGNLNHLGALLTSKVNSAFHPSGVGKLCTGLSGWALSPASDYTQHCVISVALRWITIVSSKEALGFNRLTSMQTRKEKLSSKKPNCCLAWLRNQSVFIADLMIYSLMTTIVMMRCWRLRTILQLLQPT